MLSSEKESREPYISARREGLDCDCKMIRFQIRREKVTQYRYGFAGPENEVDFGLGSYFRVRAFHIVTDDVDFELVAVLLAGL